jgi:hypothetical protein
MGDREPEEANGPPASPLRESEGGHHETPYTSRQQSRTASQGQHSTGMAAASSAMSAAATWLNRVGHLARDYAVVAGQHIDRAADSINASVDHYAQQVRVRFSDTGLSPGRCPNVCCCSRV